MRLIDADELKSKKVYSAERNEWIVPVAAIDWIHTVESAPVTHGHWIDKGMDGDWAWHTDGRGSCWHEYQCSICSAFTRKTSKYCPSCGAKMDMK